MFLRTAGLILVTAASLLLPGTIAGGQENVPPPTDDSPSATGAPLPATGEGQEDLAAIVRGLIITRHDVDKEVARMKASPMAAEMTDAMLRWQARSMLAGNILLLEEAKRFTAKIDDELVRQQWIVYRDLDPSYVDENFEALKNEFITDLYLKARCGRTILDGVVPDMASFVRVTPREIREFYHNNIDYYTQKASTILVWVLFPEASFGDAAETRRLGTACRDLFLNRGSELENVAEDYKTLSQRWPGCLPRKTVIEADSGSSFHPSIVEFVDEAAKGDVSGLINLEGGIVVAHIVDKIGGKISAFDEVQDEIAWELKSRKRKQAHLLIVEDLARKEKFFFPSDLFERKPARGQTPEQPAGK